MNPSELARKDAHLNRLLNDNIDMRRLILDIADYMDIWAIDDEALVNPESGSLEHLAARMMAFAKRRA